MKTFLLFLVVGLIAPSPMLAQIDVESEFAVTQDPGDSLYRAARRELNRGNYDEALGLFRQIRDRYPESQFAPHSLYWEAFALQRTDNLREAIGVLEELEEEYPTASTRQDAASLATRICGELARRGDRECAERVTAEARAVEARAMAAETRARAAEQREQRREQVGLKRELARQARSQSRQQAEDVDDLQIAALNALLNMDADRAVPILQRLLGNRESNPELRRRAVYLLAQHEDDATTELLLDVVRNDPDPEVRAQAVFWLSQVEDEAAVEALVTVLENPADEELHEQALFALSQHDSPRAAGVLRESAERQGAPEEFREQAIFWLGQQGGSENIEFLKRLYPRLDSERLQEKVIFSIAQSGDGEHMDWLLDQALEPDAPIALRKQAIFWAGQEDGVIGRLIPLYDRVNEEEMKQQLIFVFGQSDETKAVDKLIDIARNDTDREMRRQAIFWLGQSDDPRVVDLLLEIIDQ